MTKINIYGVYHNGKLIFKGGRREIAKEFGLRLSSTTTYCTGKVKIKGIYDVKLIGTEYRQIEYESRDQTKRVAKRPKVESVSYDYATNPFEFLVVHLKTYGNTIVSSDPSAYVNDLAKEGFNVKITPRVEHTLVKRLTTRGRKPKQKVNYLVEVVNAG